MALSDAWLLAVPLRFEAGPASAVYHGGWDD